MQFLRNILVLTCVWVSIQYLSTAARFLLTSILPAAALGQKNEVAEALRGVSSDLDQVAAVIEAFLLAQPRGQSLRRKFLEHTVRESAKHHGHIESFLDLLLTFYSAAAPFAMLLLVTRYYGREPPVIEAVAGVHPRRSESPEATPRGRPSPPASAPLGAESHLLESPMYQAHSRASGSSLNHAVQREGEAASPGGYMVRQRVTIPAPGVGKGGGGGKAGPGGGVGADPSRLDSPWGREEGEAGAARFGVGGPMAAYGHVQGSMAAPSPAKRSWFR